MHQTNGQLDYRANGLGLVVHYPDSPMHC